MPLANIKTAFQIGAFQFNGFQEGIPVAGGNWWLRYRLAARLAQRKKGELAPSPTIAEVVAIVAEAQARARLTFKPSLPRMTDLSGLAELRAKEQLDEFRALLEQIAAEMEEY